ncbi:cytosolic carboxypeptidase 3 isoform X7 [Elephas maximus indicus]|uniref:cytosolic carboxypeptidase 3 isoform X7 n=1 Tax=Elephas maximus indicus TaxID=99487 RepID=UPI002116EEBF|nr:cytosolic carboxypeptidase 3 isoform X7 [Elephas maximus indicus]
MKKSSILLFYSQSVSLKRLRASLVLSPAAASTTSSSEESELTPRLMEKREVILYCDLHGHSRKENIFMYGCDGSDRSKALYLQQRIFPLMLSKNCPDKFSFSACKFNVQKSKEGTGRVVMWKMGIRNSFTMEATFCGSTLGNKRGTHFNTKDLESMGYHFCDSLLDYCDPDRAKYFQCLKELEEMEKRINLEKIFDDSDTSLVEITLDLESSSRGSDSSESNDSQPYLLKLTSQLKTKKHLKTKKERNSTIEIHENAREEQEVCGREHLQQRYNESNANLEDTRPNVSGEYIFEYFGRQFPNQGLGTIPRPVPPWLLKNYLSSESLVQSLSKDQQRHVLGTDERPIQETIESKRTDLYGTCCKVTSLKCPVNRLTPSWTEKTRIQTEDLHHNLKSKMKGCTSFQSKKTDVNWTDDEKRIYRDKRIAQTQEMWHFLLPVVESSKHLPTTQIKQIFNPRANFQFQHQLKPATCINVKRDISSWAPSRNPIFLAQRDLVTNSSEWFQSMSQKSLEILSPLKDPKNRKKYPGVWAIKTEAKKPFSTKWETTSSSGEMDANITKDKSLQAKESSPQSSVHVARHLTENKEKQPNKNDGQPTCQVKFRRSN